MQGQIEAQAGDGHIGSAVGSSSNEWTHSAVQEAWGHRGGSTDNTYDVIEKQIADMLEQHGVKDIRRLPFQGPNDSYVLCGTV